MEVMQLNQAPSTRLVRTPHPLTTQGQLSVALVMHPGETLADLLARHDIDAAWVVEVGGIEVPHLLWGRMRVKHGQVIEARPAVHKDVVRVVALIVLAYYAPTIAASIGFAAGTVGGAIVAGAIVFAGSAIINAALPPAKATRMDPSSNDVAPTYSLSGGRNGARLWQPLPLVIGRPYAVFDLAAQPYSYFGSDDQYLQQTFHLGVNCARVNSLRIGQTDLATYTDFRLAARGVSVTGRNPASALPSTNVDTTIGAALDAPTAPGPWVTRTSSINTQSLAIDIEASLYAVDSRTGAWQTRHCNLDVQIAVAGSGNWVGVQTGTSRLGTKKEFRQDWYYVGYGENGGFEFGWVEVDVPATLSAPAGTAWLSGSSSKPVRVTLQIDPTAHGLPASGQFDVRLRKATANDTGTSAANVVTFTQLRSFQRDPLSYPGQALLALTIKASGQLSGAIEEFNGVLTAKPHQHWDGSAWVTATAPTTTQNIIFGNRVGGLSNPGSIILAYARGHYDENGRLMAGLGWPDSRIDIESLKAFTVWCTARGFRFDAYLQDAMSHEDFLTAVAYAGMGSISMADGRIGVQYLDPDQPVEGVINMGNIKARTFSVTYAGQERADEIEYGYFDAAQGNNWTSLRVKAPGVTMPRSTARLSNLGITQEAQAAVLARRAMAENLYMAKAISFEQDLEHITYRRGTVLALSHDMTQWGYSGRLRGASINAGVVTLELDDEVPANSSGRYIGLRLLGEAQYRIFTVAAFTGTARSVTLVGAWPAGVALPGTTAHAREALWIYDFTATPGQKVVVASIEPGDDQSGAKVTVVPLPNEFWPFVLAGAYTPAPNRSLLATKASVERASVTEVLQRVGNGFAVELALSAVLGPQTDRIEVIATAGGTEQRLQSRTGTVTWTAGTQQTWSITIWPYNALGARGDAYTLSHTTLDLYALPGDVQFFTIEGQTLSWSTVTDPDVVGYEIRFSTSLTPDWGTAQAIHSGLITASPYTLPNIEAQGSLLIKAVDSTGGQSRKAATITYQGGSADAGNVLASVSMAAQSWPGALAGGSRVGTSIVAGETVNYMWSANPQVSMYASPERTFYAGQSFEGLAFEYTFSPAYVAGGQVVATASASSAYALQYRTSSAHQWLPWLGPVPATDGAAYQFRLTTAAGRERGQVNDLTLSFAVPEVDEYLDNVAIAATGTRLPIAKTWRNINSVLLTVQTSGTAAISAKVLDKNNTAGPLVQCLDAAGNAVAGLIDAKLRGY